MKFVGSLVERNRGYRMPSTAFLANSIARHADLWFVCRRHTVAPHLEFAIGRSPSNVLAAQIAGCPALRCEWLSWVGGAAGAGRDHWTLALLRQPEPPPRNAALAVIGCTFVLLLALCTNELSTGPGQPEASCDHGRRGSSGFPGFVSLMVAGYINSSGRPFCGRLQLASGIQLSLRLGHASAWFASGFSVPAGCCFSGIGRLCVILAGSGPPCELG